MSEDQKGKGVIEENEDVSMGEFEDEEWEHSIFSQSTDEDRTFSDNEEITYLSEEVTKNPGWQYEVEREFYVDLYIRRNCDVGHCPISFSESNDLYRRVFTITEEKTLKFARQDKIRAEFGVLLNKRLDITHESDAEDVFYKLQSEGLVRMPKNFALPSIRGAIYKRSSFHVIDQQFEIVKRLITAVPCIKLRTNILSVFEFLKQTDLALGFDRDTIFMGITYFEDVVGEIERRFHPVIRKELSKLMIANAERHSKFERRRFIRSQVQYKVQHDEVKQIEDESSKVYQDSLKVVELHQAFHKHVESCYFITHDMRIEDLIKDKRVVGTRFEILDQALIIATLKVRLSLLKEMDEFALCESWLNCIVADKINLGRSCMDEILDMIRAKHPNFPQLLAKWTFEDLKHLQGNWSNDQKVEEMCAFYELLDQVKEYTRCDVSYEYLVEAILEYVAVSTWRGATPRERNVWDEAFYDHEVYKNVYEDMFCQLVK